MNRRVGIVASLCHQNQSDPISLGFDDGPETRGFPRPASPDDRAALLAALQELSAPYGTRVELDKDGCLSFAPG